MSVVLPNGDTTELPITVSASQRDCIKQKDAAIERGELSLGRLVPAHVAVLRKKEGEDGGHHLIDVDEPGRLIPVRETLLKAVESLIENRELRLFIGTHTQAMGASAALGG